MFPVSTETFEFAKFPREKVSLLISLWNEAKGIFERNELSAVKVEISLVALFYVSFSSAKLRYFKTSSFVDKVK